MEDGHDSQELLRAWGGAWPGALVGHSLGCLARRTPPLCLSSLPGDKCLVADPRGECRLASGPVCPWGFCTHGADGVLSVGGA